MIKILIKNNFKIFGGQLQLKAAEYQDHLNQNLKKIIYNNKN